jgi:hypothetical protein
MVRPAFERRLAMRQIYPAALIARAFQSALAMVFPS